MNKLIKEIPRAIIISLAVFLVLLLIRFITGNTILFNYSLLVNFGYTMLYGLSLFYANAILFIYLDAIFKTERFTINRVIIGFLASFCISIFVIFLLRVFEDVIIEGRSFTAFLTK